MSESPVSVANYATDKILPSMCNSLEWTHTYSMRGYETAVLGHIYDNLKYTQKMNATCYIDNTNKLKLCTKGKHVPTKCFPTACNARNFNSIKSSWPKCTPNAIQEQRRHRSLISALPERNVSQYFTPRATHTNRQKHTG